jgi:hypothetical protein
MHLNHKCIQKMELKVHEKNKEITKKTKYFMCQKIFKSLHLKI